MKCVEYMAAVLAVMKEALFLEVQSQSRLMQPAALHHYHSFSRWYV
jgi:hypothetical protein